MLFSFDDFTLDCERRELHARGTIIPVEPQIFDLLVYLITNRDRVVSKDDLIASVWSGRVVSDSTVDSRINAARKAIGDSGDRQRLLRTIARKGFRFVGDVKDSSATGPAVAPLPQPTLNQEARRPTVFVSLTHWPVTAHLW